MCESRISRETWEQVKIAYAAGAGLREIARKMNTPEGTVLAHAQRKGWTRQIWSGEARRFSRPKRALLPTRWRLFGGLGDKVAWINRSEDSRLLESVRHWTGNRKAIAQ